MPSIEGLADEPCLICNHLLRHHVNGPEVKGACQGLLCRCDGFVFNPTPVADKMGRLYEEAVLEPDMVNHPPHYKSGSIEVWDFIIDQDLSYASGNVVKYISRAGKKGKDTHLQDLEKAQAYLKREIQRVKDLLKGDKSG